MESLRKHISTTTLGTVSEPLPHRRRAAAYPFCLKCQRGKVNMKVRQRSLITQNISDRLRDHTKSGTSGSRNPCKPCPGTRGGARRPGRQPPRRRRETVGGADGRRRCGSVHGSGAAAAALESSQHDCTESEPPSSKPSIQPTIVSGCCLGCPAMSVKLRPSSGRYKRRTGIIERHHSTCIVGRATTTAT